MDAPSPGLMCILASFPGARANNLAPGNETNMYPRNHCKFYIVITHNLPDCLLWHIYSAACGKAFINANYSLYHRYHCKPLRFPWHGLWWVVLLQYTHVVHTSTSTPNCPMIEGQDTGGAPVRSCKSILPSQ